MMESLLTAAELLMTPATLLALVLGTVFGMIVGAMPGLGSVLAITIGAVVSIFGPMLVPTITTAMQLEGGIGGQFPFGAEEAFIAIDARIGDAGAPEGLGGLGRIGGVAHDGLVFGECRLWVMPRQAGLWRARNI